MISKVQAKYSKMINGQQTVGIFADYFYEQDTRCSFLIRLDQQKIISHPQVCDNNDMESDSDILKIVDADLKLFCNDFTFADDTIELTEEDFVKTINDSNMKHLLLESVMEKADAFIGNSSISNYVKNSFNN